jgi:hypothetical protein
MRETLVRHSDFGPALRVSARSPQSGPHRKRADAPQLNTIAPRHRGNYLFKHGAHDLLDVGRAQVQLRSSNALD